MQKTLHDLLSRAQQWRDEYCFTGRGGYVIFSPAGEIGGWDKSLLDPSAWMPGCIAVGEHGSQMFATTGGDAQYGAGAWVSYAPIQFPEHNPFANVESPGLVLPTDRSLRRNELAGAVALAAELPPGSPERAALVAQANQLLVSLGGRAML